MSSRRFALVGILCVVCTGSRAAAQGLGEASKKEKSRREKAGTGEAKPVRSYTNGDLVGGGEPANGAASESQSAPPALKADDSSSRSRAASPPTSPPGQGEAYWRQRAREARNRVARAESRVAALNLEAAKGTYGFAGPGCNIAKSGMNMTTEEVKKWKCYASSPEAIAHQETLKKLDEAKAELERARRALGDLAEEGRKANALPGWLRD
jgi:hypothetical protein